jgi:DNA-binding FadR family transcriptional regulator
MRSSHDVAADIRRKIDSGEWADGFRVPPERELAATYRLARNTVRRALQELDGSLVRVLPSYSQEGAAVYLVHPATSHLPRRA